MAGTDTERYSLRLQGTIYAAAFFNANIFHMVSVVMPLWALSLHASPLMIGVFLGSRQLLLVFLAIHGGALMDRFGARRVILVFGFVGTLSMALFPVFPTLGAGIALQMFGGLAESINWIGVQALVARSLEGLPTYTGRMTFVARIGGFAGPPLIGAAWDLFGGPGAFAALALWVACGWAAAWMVPETGTAAPAREQAARRIRLADLVPSAADYAATFRLLAIGAVALVIAATVVRQAGSAMQSSFYVVWLEGIGISGTAIGALLGLSAALAAISSLAVGPLTRRIGAHWLLLAMVFVSIVAMAITPLLGTYAFLMTAIAVRGLSQGLNLPLLISIMARAVAPDDQAKAVALRITVNRANSALVPVLMGAAAEVVGLENSFYAVGGAGLALLALLALWVWRAPAFRDGTA